MNKPRREGASRPGEQAAASKKRDELLVSREEGMEAKKERLAEIKEMLFENFGVEELPRKPILEGFVSIRREIAESIEEHEYQEELPGHVRGDILMLAMQVARFQERDNIERVFETDEGVIQIDVQGQESIEISDIEGELVESLMNYFESYRLSKNAHSFRSNVEKVKKEVVEDNETRKLNFYEESEKKAAVVKRLEEIYGEAGFSEEEIENLLEFSDLSDVSKLEVHEIKVLSKIGKIFGKFLKGDAAKYTGLSAALLVPAFLNGYAPKFLIDSFSGDGIEATQVMLFALTSAAGAASSFVMDRKMKKFLDDNFAKEGGMGEHIADNLSALPAEVVDSYGTDVVKTRVADGKGSYEEVLRIASGNIAPAVVTIMTSAAVLIDKSPLIAAGTAIGSGIWLAMDKFIQKKGRFWERQGKAKERREELLTRMTEQLEARMEIVLSGEKDKFADLMQDMLTEEAKSSTDFSFLMAMQNRFRETAMAVNTLVALGAAIVAGGGFEMFIAALSYSNRIAHSITDVAGSHRRMLIALKDMHQMDLMFNGYAEHEQDAEEGRVDVSSIEGSGIRLEGVTVEYGDKKILDDISLEIPEGTMTHLHGLSGAGKTTLMKVMSGYYVPSEGSAEFGGVNMQDIKHKGPESIYSKTSYLPQFPFIKEATVRENVAFGIREEVSDKDVRQVLEEVGLNKRLSKLKERLKGGRGDTGSLSGGEASRLGLARAILKIRKSDSRLVFLDEPTASVDPKTKRDIADIINKERAARPEVSFVVISHDSEFLSMIEHDNEIHMEDGKVIEQGRS